MILGSAVSPQAGSWTELRPKTNLLRSKAARKLVAIILSILKCMLYSRMIKI